MINRFLTNIKGYKYLLPLCAMFVFIGCGGDDDPGTGGGGGGTDNPIASFQFEVDANNFLTVVFSNFSQNATSYTWDFGDGNNSADENPTHVYAEAGTYTVTLTASNAAGTSAQRSETFTLVDPNQQLALLAGQTSKTWYLLREGIALGIGPSVNNNEFWSFGGVTPLGDRPCILDDSYTFFRDGTFEANTNGTIFADSEDNGGWKESEGCLDENDSDSFVHWSTGEDVSAFANGGNYTYNFDSDNNVMTVNGLGAYIGLANKTNNGDNYLPIDLKTYTVFNLAEGDVADTLGLALEGSGFSWNFYLVSYDNISDLPEIPSIQPRAAFDFNADNLSVTFVNQSANAESYSWDFGDGGMSTEREPSHTYAMGGDYDVTLTVMDANGQSDFITKTISVSDASFSADVVSDMSGKIWRLAGEGSYKVGSFPNGGDFWPGLDAAGVIERACQMDDEFIFTDGGALTIDVKDEVWAEAYMGGTNICLSTMDLLSPFDVYGGGNFGFEVINNNGVDQLRVTGQGAYLGFNRPFNGGELTDDGLGTPASEITYDIIGYISTPTKDQLVLAIDYVGDGCCYWTITIESLK